MQYVSDTAAGKAITAICIIKGGKVVAHVTAAYGSGGGVLVNVDQHGEPAKRSLKMMLKRNPKFKTEYPGDGLTQQSAKAGGYGYDKFTAAISGMIIDGHEITNHCGKSLPLPKGKTVFPRDFKAPKGYRLANFSSPGNAFRKARGTDDGTEGYMDCYRQSGLDYLRDIGYTIEKIL